MTQSLTILVATHYKPLVSLLERAMQGRATVRQVDPRAETVLNSVGINDNALVALHAEKGNDDWLSLLKALHDSCPRLKTLAFGEATDVGAVARGIIHGLTGYFPMALGTDLLEVSKAVSNAVVGADAPADSVFGRVKAMLPSAHDGTYLSPKGKSISSEDAIQQCIGLGLTPEETAGFLGVSVDEASKVAGKAHRRPRVGSLEISGRLKVAGVILIASLTLLGLLGRRKEKYFVPVSGTVGLNGQPLRDVIVYFSREGGSHIASGKTDGAGKYRLSTLRQGDGAEEGTHVVWVGVPSRIRDHIDMNDPKYTEKMIQLREKMRAERESKGKDEEVVPAPYRDMQSSPLRAEVKGRQPMNLDFDLKK